MRFTKMHGLGNDYLYVYGEVPENIEELAVKLSDRHTGAGSDGMIYITPSSKADFGMRIFNSDGSEAAAEKKPAEGKKSSKTFKVSSSTKYASRPSKENRPKPKSDNARRFSNARPVKKGKGSYKKARG